MVVVEVGRTALRAAILAHARSESGGPEVAQCERVFASAPGDWARLFRGKRAVEAHERRDARRWSAHAEVANDSSTAHRRCNTHIPKSSLLRARRRIDESPRLFVAVTAANERITMQGRRVSALRLAGAVGAVSAVWSYSPAAHAEDLSQTVYQDVKSVIQELMVDEVAKTTIPNAACQAPILLRYYPNSMQQLFDRQLGSLKGQLRTESASLLGSFVYKSLKVGSLDLVKFLRDESPSLTVTLDACPQRVRDDGGPKYFTDVSSKDDLVSDLVAQCGSNYPAEDTIPCELGMAAEAYVLDDKYAAESHLRRVIAYLLAKAHNLATSAQVEELAVLVATYVKDPGITTPPKVVDKTLADLLAADPSPLVVGLQAIAREWQMLTGAGKSQLSPRALTDVMLSAALPVLKAACDADASCQRLEALSRDVNTRALMDAVKRQDVRAIAVESLRASLTGPKTATDCKPTDSGLNPEGFHPEAQQALYSMTAGTAPTCIQETVVTRYGRFIATLASYVLEDRENGEPTDATREAFRSAAFELLRTDGPQSGFDRGFLGTLVIPQPTLRFAWAPTYINEATTNGFRYAATLDWLTARWQFKYDQSVYVAGSLSLVDLLGPFSESALRQQSPVPLKSARVWSMFLNPRLEAAVGLPSLSRHLAFVAGVSYRAAGAFRDPADDKKLTYYTWLSGDRPLDYENRPAAFATQFIESSLGLRYVP